jgi:hypothetical protein
LFDRPKPTAGSSANGRRRIQNANFKHKRAAKLSAKQMAAATEGTKSLRTCSVFCHRNVRRLQLAKAELSIKLLRMAQH